MSDSAIPVSSPALADVYRRLYDAYGPRGWWPGDGPFDVIIGAILTQAASWKNVELALANMKAADCWSFPAIAAIPQDQLAEIVRSSGYFNAKAAKLKAFAAHVLEFYGGDLDRMFAQETATLRRELLSIHGIGPETADDILVYAAGKPSFVIDAYTIRILERLGIVPDGGQTPVRRLAIPVSRQPARRRTSVQRVFTPCWTTTPAATAAKPRYAAGAACCRCVPRGNIA